MVEQLCSIAAIKSAPASIKTQVLKFLAVHAFFAVSSSAVGKVCSGSHPLDYCVISEVVLDSDLNCPNTMNPSPPRSESVGHDGYLMACKSFRLNRPLQLCYRAGFVLRKPADFCCGQAIAERIPAKKASNLLKSCKDCLPLICDRLSDKGL